MVSVAFGDMVDQPEKWTSMGSNPEWLPHSLPNDAMNCWTRFFHDLESALQGIICCYLKMEEDYLEELQLSERRMAQ